MKKTNQEFWESAARRICFRVNFGFWLHAFLRALAGLAVLGGLALLLTRRMEIGTGPVWMGLIAGTCLLSIAAWMVSRRKFYDREDAMIRLEARLRLNNRLTAARAQIAAWPEPIPVPPLFTWSWKRILPLPVFAIIFVALAGAIPVGQTEAREAPHPEEPLSWQQVESWTETLEETGGVDEEILQAWKEQVDALRNRPAEEWYSHSSLEAGDSLRRNAEHAIRELQQALEKTAYPLAAAHEKALTGLTGNLNPLLEETWLDALASLQEANLRLSPDLLAQLGEVDFSNLQTMDASQIERLREMLRENAEACGVCLGGPGDGDGEMVMLASPGGISKGPGEAPLRFSEFPSLHETERREAVTNTDFSHAALGDTLGVTRQDPESESESYSGLQAGGDTASPGEGGEAVWRSRLTPAEQQKLKRYFD